MSDIFFISIAANQEENADQVGQRGVHGLEHLLERVMLVLIVDRPARNEVGEPQRVEAGELIDLIGPHEPVFPEIEVFVVNHAAHALQR